MSTEFLVAPGGTYFIMTYNVSYTKSFHTATSLCIGVYTGGWGGTEFPSNIPFVLECILGGWLGGHRISIQHSLCIGMYTGGLGGNRIPIQHSLCIGVYTGGAGGGTEFLFNIPFVLECILGGLRGHRIDQTQLKMN